MTHAIGQAAATPRLRIFDDASSLADAATRFIREAAIVGTSSRDRFTLALSGGSTPRAVYERLGDDEQLPWDKLELCFGDERAVPPEHPDSNARMVRETLLRRGFGGEQHVHRVPAELPAAQAAAEYERTLRGLFPAATLPRFDLVLLGLGTDAHTASLFPASPALTEQDAWVAANWVEKLGVHRITLTFPALNAAASVLFLVSGSDKAPALRSVFAAQGEVSVSPARGVRPTHGELIFFVDRAAAAELERNSAGIQ